MKFMVGFKDRYLVSLYEPCPYWRERRENNWSFTLTQYGCTFYYKSSVPETLTFKSRRQLLIIIFKEQKGFSFTQRVQCWDISINLQKYLFRIQLKNSVCVCVYILCIYASCQKNTVLPIWIILIHIPYLKTQKSFHIWFWGWWDYLCKFMNFIKRSS